MPKVIRAKLNTIGRVASELATVYRQVKAGALESAEGLRRAQILTALRQCLELSNIEQRVLELERQSEQRPERGLRVVGGNEAR
jgi:repressor of nif and glnA expression